MQRDTGGNEASRRVVEKLGFAPERVQRLANLLPGGRVADKHCYARLDLVGLPSLEVQWGGPKHWIIGQGKQFVGEQ